MRVSLVAALADNGVIGRDGGLPWRLPDDLRHFKQLTMGHVVVMGRRTFESVGRALPGRRTIVLSRDAGYRAEGAETARSLDEALRLADDASEVFVVGGADVYRTALARADRLVLTQVHAPVVGDVRFPPFSLDEWVLDAERHHPTDAQHPYAFTIRYYSRRATGETNTKKTIA